MWQTILKVFLTYSFIRCEAGSQTDVFRILLLTCRQLRQAAGLLGLCLRTRITAEVFVHAEISVPNSTCLIVECLLRTDVFYSFTFLYFQFLCAIV